MTVDWRDEQVAAWKQAHQAMRRALRGNASPAERQRVGQFKHGDLGYGIDGVAEGALETLLDQPEFAETRVICEGLDDRWPQREAPRYVAIVDPLDGTRPLMHDLRSAWILTGVTTVTDHPTLADIEVAVQTELPTSYQTAATTLWATRNGGAFEEIVDVQTGEVLAQRRLEVAPASSLRHGFCSLVNFFPGDRARATAMGDALVRRLFPDTPKGQAHVFEDQYLSTGGQLALLATGRYRFVADLRAHLRSDGLCAHPYDLCTALIAQEAGCIVTASLGEPLAYPLDTSTNCSWVGYVNAAVHTEIAGVWHEIVRTMQDGE